MSHSENNITVAIVGAGPAGLTCAKYLHGAGFKTALFDHKAPWEKPCGGILTSQVFKQYLDKNNLRNTFFHDITWVSPRNDRVVVNYKDGFMIVSRKDLSDYLIYCLNESGMGVISKRVRDVHHNGEFWIIDTGETHQFADIIVGADGVNSLVRKATVGEFRREDLAISVGYYIEPTENPICITITLDIIGFAWILSASDHASAGVMAQWGTITPKDLYSRLDNLLCHYMPDAKIMRKYSALIPSANDPSFFEAPCAGDNWLLAGDAAGHVDPLMGEGISYAMKSGELAARAIIAGDIQIYDKLWHESYGDKLHALVKKKQDMLIMAKDFGPMAYGANIYSNRF